MKQERPNKPKISMWLLLDIASAACQHTTNAVAANPDWPYIHQGSFEIVLAPSPTLRPIKSESPQIDSVQWSFFFYVP